MSSTKACLCGLLFALLGGCAWFGPKVAVDRLTLDVAVKANGDTPIAVDFVAVRDADLLKLLGGVTAAQWFSEREQFRRDYQQQLSVWSVELVPGQLMQTRDFPLAGKPAAGLLVFAGYNTPGAHRMRLERQADVWLRFDSREMRLLSANPQ